MKVKDFCKLVNLEESQVECIHINRVGQDKVYELSLREADLEYKDMPYDTVAEWFVKAFGNDEILEDNHIYNKTLYCSTRMEVA